MRLLLARLYMEISGLIEVAFGYHFMRWRIKRVLRWSARHDPDPEVRAVAAEQLKRLESTHV